MKSEKGKKLEISSSGISALLLEGNTFLGFGDSEQGVFLVRVSKVSTVRIAVGIFFLL